LYTTEFILLLLDNAGTDYCIHPDMIFNMSLRCNFNPNPWNNESFFLSHLFTVEQMKRERKKEETIFTKDEKQRIISKWSVTVLFLD